MADTIDVFLSSNTNAIAATATSQARAFATGGSDNQLAVFYNDGPSVAFVTMGAPTVVATLPALNAAAGAEGNATPVPVGSSISLRKGHVSGQHNTYWAVICPAGLTANVYCTPGEGL